MLCEVNEIKGGVYKDERGTVLFVNDFTFNYVKRFYQIDHPDTTVVRAWQGHKVEHKHFFVVSGSFLIAWVKIDDWQNPSPALKAKYTIVTSSTPKVLSIPPGYANGIKAQTPNSILTVYSSLTLKESEEDRWSFKNSLWLNWNEL